LMLRVRARAQRAATAALSTREARHLRASAG
jgi:hypothetical protein